MVHTGILNSARAAQGEFPSFLNELWLAPIDFSPNAWECFFTGEDTLGMTSMAFGQRAAEKLVPLAGLEAVCPDEMLAQHKLLELQKIMGGWQSATAPLLAPTCPARIQLPHEPMNGGD